MRRRRRSSFRKEKAIMLTSSALVLTALTATGFYVRNLGRVEEDQIIDFADLEEETIIEQVQESADGTADEEPVYDMYGQIITEEDLMAQNQQAAAGDIDSGELDYDPNFTEVTSPDVENPGLTAEGVDGNDTGTEQADTEENDSDMAVSAPEEMENVQPVSAAAAEGAPEETQADEVSALPALTFTESEALAWPIVGNVLVNYSMDRTVYFATLQQYQYSPAIVISAVEGEGIAAAADGKVTRIYTDPEIGTAVVMDLGDGYELTYGQLTDLTVSEGNYVSCGEIIGKVAVPTKYYSVEGTNVYFKMTKDGKPVNPLNKLG